MIDTWSAMDESASFPFILAIREGEGTAWAQLQQGMQTAIPAADTSKDIASGWASTVDQTILSTTASILLNRPAINITK